jgi:hypothetical protein
MIRYGFMVADGIRVPVTGMRLRKGFIELTCERWGPVRAVNPSPVTVFGEDDLGIAQGGSVFWPEARRGELLSVTLTFQMTRVD